MRHPVISKRDSNTGRLAVSRRGGLQLYSLVQGRRYWCSFIVFLSLLKSWLWIAFYMSCPQNKSVVDYKTTILNVGEVFHIPLQWMKEIEGIHYSSKWIWYSRTFVPRHLSQGTAKMFSSLTKDDWYKGHAMYHRVQYSILNLATIIGVHLFTLFLYWFRLYMLPRYFVNHRVTFLYIYPSYLKRSVGIKQPGSSLFDYSSVWRCCWR